MMMLSSPQPWKTQLGAQRDWFWRGWRIRYTFLRPSQAARPDAPPLLFVHGFGASLTQWHANLAPLSLHHPVYALDLLGFGTSEKAVTRYNVGLWADQVFEFWQTLIRRPVILVGHSLGALVAATATATYPDMVAGLVTITLPATRQELLPASWLQPIVGNLERLFASPLLIRLIFKVARRPEFIRFALNLAYVDRQRVTEELISSFVLPTCDRGAAGTLCQLSRAATQTDYSLSRKALLSQIQRPMLMLWGEQDRIVAFEQAQTLAALNPNLTFVPLPNAGHCPYDECYERVNTEILNWAQRLRPDS